MDKGVTALADMYATVHPDAALERERLEALKRQIEKCCPPRTSSRHRSGNALSVRDDRSSAEPGDGRGRGSCCSRHGWTGAPGDRRKVDGASSQEHGEPGAAHGDVGQFWPGFDPFFASLASSGPGRTREFQRQYFLGFDVPEDSCACQSPARRVGLNLPRTPAIDSWQGARADAEAATIVPRRRRVARSAQRLTVGVEVEVAGSRPRCDQPASANRGAALPEIAAHALTIVGGLVRTIARAANSQALSVHDGGHLISGRVCPPRRAQA
jgi:hypothetical protein